ncbi:MAG: yiaD [Chitinophagaceae bacterium]|nr:yiaD [Chitinophagaceae bacterium]
MSKLFYTSFFCLFIQTCFAQTPVLFDEQFNNNINLWPSEEAIDYTCQIKEGSYYITHKKPAFGTTFVSATSFDPELDFEIEAKITLTGGSNNYGFGLYTIDTRSSKAKLEHNFVISGNGYYRLYSIDANGIETVHKEWEKTNAVNIEYDQANILSIKKTGLTSSFLINGTEVMSIPHTSFWGTKVGFIINDTEIVKIDYITVKQDRGKINTIENKTSLKKENLGPNINSKIHDVTPVISHDGKVLYFSVRGDQPVSGNNYDGEAYYSTLNKDNTWNKRKSLGRPINNEETNFIISVTPDNNSLLLSGRYLANGKSNGAGFSISHRELNGWSMPEDLIIEDYYDDNIFGSFCLSADRQTLVLSIERKDSYGQTDLYVSFLKSDNTWTAPKNIGHTVNTFGSEETPFLAADGKTLYFSSNGKPGFGSNDIFMSRRLDDKWTEPLNLGPQVNTKDWDAYYTIPASGDYAYLVSGENSLGLSDIFRIKVSESAKPEPVVIIHGKVLDKVTKQPLGATIDYHELSSGTDAGSARSNPTDGSYKIILPYGKAYGFLAEKTNFLAESDNIDLTTIKEYTEIERDLYLSPIEVGKTIMLNNVFFVKSKAELLPGSFSELDRLVKVLTDNPELKIEISGHTDNVGDAALNLKLSEDRVATIKNYLISKNISAKRLSGKGYGGSKPIASNATEETRKLNRRVEFIIVGK